MKGAGLWSRILVIVGLAAMVIGALDPIEGSLVILPGTGLVALGARLGSSRHRVLLYRSFVLVAVGVGALWGVSYPSALPGRLDPGTRRRHSQIAGALRSRVG